MFRYGDKHRCDPSHSLFCIYPVFPTADSADQSWPYITPNAWLWSYRGVSYTESLFLNFSFMIFLRQMSIFVVLVLICSVFLFLQISMFSLVSLLSRIFSGSDYNLVISPPDLHFLSNLHFCVRFNSYIKNLNPEVFIITLVFSLSQKKYAITDYSISLIFKVYFLCYILMKILNIYTDLKLFMQRNYIFELGSIFHRGRQRALFGCSSSYTG